MFADACLSLSLCHPTHIPQLHLNLTDTTNKEFYEFVTNFFETDTVMGGTENTGETSQVVEQVCF